MTAEPSLSLTAPSTHLSAAERVGVACVVVGVVALGIALTGAGAAIPGLLLALAFGGLALGTLLLLRRYLTKPAGVDNDGVWQSSQTGRGLVGWAVAVAFTLFYCLLYWWPQTLAGLVALFDPFADAIGYPEGVEARRWVMYGALYTFAVVVMGVRALVKYRHTPYQIIRTLSVMFFQAGFGFAIPYLMVALGQPEYYFHYFWPLKYDYGWPGALGWLPVVLFVFGLLMIFVVTPVLTYFFGKRWYCSWVCGCGGLAETLGDPYRQLSDKSTRAWKIERWSVHGVLALVILTTLLLWLHSATGMLGGVGGTLSSFYGFGIGLVFSGVVGVGFYPLMGSRVWCRYGCPMAAILGLQQRFFSRFRITTNGGQCISCGNCSTYCEMGIDVKWYAQRGQNVIRASCVGCGICATVCPRGVLKLENGPREGRFNGPVLFAEADLDVLPD